MVKSKLNRFVIAIGAMAILTYIIIGNPVVFVNNQKLKKAVVTITSTSVELNKLVPFEWDELYTFDPYTSKGEIEKTIGFKSNSIKESVSEGMVQLLFIKDEKVVCSICNYPRNLGYEIRFNEKILWEDHAVFSVKRDATVIHLLYN